VVEALKALPALFVIAAPPLLAGLFGRFLMGLAWPVLFCVLAVTSAASEPRHYDMPGFGLGLYGAAAVGALLALVVGTGIRRLRT
jgi:hypothetical protein